ncbi:MAG: hypothetical protein K0R26_724 [Bacteroidota bacterium]|jgi:hypothetical protein|nr:hypothetical protein [Bacteroidota bacterium]
MLYYSKQIFRQKEAHFVNYPVSLKNVLTEIAPRSGPIGICINVIDELITITLEITCLKHIQKIKGASNPTKSDNTKKTRIFFHLL